VFRFDIERDAGQFPHRMTLLHPSVRTCGHTMCDGTAPALRDGATMMAWSRPSDATQGIGRGYEEYDS